MKRRLQSVEAERLVERLEDRVGPGEPPGAPPGQAAASAAQQQGRRFAEIRELGGVGARAPRAAQHAGDLPSSRSGAPTHAASS